MDPDLVRLILIVLGVLLVVGIYLWDRFKRLPPRARPQRRRHSPAAFDEAAAADTSDAALDNTTAARHAAERRPQPDFDLPEEQLAQDQAEMPKDEATEAPTADDWTDVTDTADPQFSMDLSFSADSENDGTVGQAEGVEPLIVVMHVISRDHVMGGPALVKACAELGLQGGDMSIYHRLDRGGGVMFSMASMVEPGTFPLDDMAGFETPGLSLFMQLPGVRDGIETYEAMLQTAQGLAAALKAELLDERHNKMTRQMQDHTRETIIEQRRRIRLARSRR
jgi:cell division protein ZipA